MNANQKWVIIVGATVVFVMMLFPPFSFPVSAGSSAVFNQGYSFLFLPPEGGRATVNFSTLVLQWFTTFIVGGAVYIVVPDTSKKHLF